MTGRWKMPSAHPSWEDYEGFLQGTSVWAAQHRNSRVRHHLLVGCTVCRDGLRGMTRQMRRLACLFGSGAEPAPAETAMAGCDYTPAFAAAARAVSAFLAP